MGNPQEWERQRAEPAHQRQQHFGQAALRAYNRVREMDAQTGQDLQFEDGNCKITVKNGYHRGDGRGVGGYTTDVLVLDRNSSSGAGWHVVFDENGNVVHQGWKSDRG